MSQLIHFYQHTDSGAVHGFTHPLPKEIAKQVRAGELALVADESGTDPHEEIARLRAQLAAMAQASGIDPSSLETDGLADTPVSSDEPAPEGAEAVDEPHRMAWEKEGAPDPDDEDAGEDVHLCLECGEPVERKGKTGPWPQRHPECK